MRATCEHRHVNKYLQILAFGYCLFYSFGDVILIGAPHLTQVTESVKRSDTRINWSLRKRSFAIIRTTIYVNPKFLITIDCTQTVTNQELFRVLIGQIRRVPARKGSKKRCIGNNKLS